MGKTSKRIFWIATGTIAAWAVAVKPRTKGKPDMSAFSAYDYANGGLHDYCKKFPENTIDSFEAAYKHGYGIVMPVRITKDEVPVVFADHELWRMCDVDGAIEELTLDEVKELSLIGTDKKIPTLFEALEAVDGQVPVLIQLKPHGGNESQLCECAAETLDKYEGIYAVESLEYKCVRWFMRNRPAVIRGQMLEKSVDFGDTIISFLSRFAKNWLLTNNMTRPDFISAHVVDRRSISLRFCRLLYHVPVMHWNVCTLKEYERSRMEDAIVTFEDIEP